MNSPAAGELLPLLSMKVQGTETGAVLVIPNEIPGVIVSGTREPVASFPCHWKAVTVPTEPPPEKSTTRRTSPLVWVPMKGAPLEGGGALLSGLTGFWKNQKPTVAEPLLS